MIASRVGPSYEEVGIPEQVIFRTRFVSFFISADTRKLATKEGQEHHRGRIEGRENRFGGEVKQL